MPPAPSFSQPSGLRRGFTLIELLTVIAIIGILAAIIIASTGAVRSQAARIQCAASMRTWGMAMLVWSNENRNLLPTHDATSVTDAGWQNRIAQVALEPTANRFTIRTRHPCPREPIDWVYATSFGFVNPTLSQRITRMSQITDPSRSVILAERNAAVIYSTHTTVGVRFAPNFERHNGRANYFFADGHVAVHTAASAREARLFLPGLPPD